jgi:HEAT repeat protein
VRSPDPALRTKAIVLLAHSPSDAATSAVVSAVDDPNETVQRVALAAIGAQGGARAVTAVSKLVQTHPNWAMRVLAVEALGRLGSAGSGGEAGKQLRAAAVNDAYALVREAALKSLASFDGRGAQQLGLQMSKSDPEPRVRETARILAAGGH